MRQDLSIPSEIPQKNIVIITDITLEPFMRNELDECFMCIEDKVDITFIPYHERHEENSIHKLEKADMVVVWVCFEGNMYNIMIDMLSERKEASQLLKDMFNICKSLYYEIDSVSRARLVWFSFDTLLDKTNYVLGSITSENHLVDRINTLLYEFLNNRAIIIDTVKLIGQVGAAAAYDYRNHYRWNLPYSKAMIKTSAKEIFRQYELYRGRNKKCLVLDCDNVLWGGILSEDGVYKVKLGTMGNGRIYHDFQKFLLMLYYHGVILAICSKNELSDVKEMFLRHSGMIIKDEHISCYQVNWNDKASNIKKISEVLNLGLDSMVFVDDSIHEIEAVKTILPEVTSILFEPEYIYSRLSCFNLAATTDFKNITVRNSTYKSNGDRNCLRDRLHSYEEYLKALETKVTISHMDRVELLRVIELSQRTNRFTNGRRLTETDMKGIFENDTYKKYVVYVSDKFGDLGLVGAVIINSGYLELICLSCRVLGRRVEDDIFEFINRNHKIESMYFCNTNRNEELYDVLRDSLLREKDKPGEEDT